PQSEKRGGPDLPDTRRASWGDLFLWGLLRLVLQCRIDEAGEKRVAVARRGGELRVELDAHEPGMLRKLHDFGQLFGGRAGADHHACLFEARDVGVVDLVAMAVPLVDFVAIDGLGAAARLDRTALRTLAHGAPQVGCGVAPLD